MAATTAAALACLLFLMIGSARLQDAETPLCQRPGCNCVQNTASCEFAPDQVVQLGAGALPAGSSVSVVSVSGPRELHVLAGALSGVRLLQRLRLRTIGKVVLRKAALHAYAEPHAILEVSDCGVLVVESKACQGLRGALIALVARCGHVLLQAGVFARLLALAVAHVPHLQMQSNALALDISAGQATVVNLTHVLMPELAKHTFPSPAVEVRLQDCEVVSVREEAFSALSLGKLSVVNSSLHDVAASAFSDRTLIDQLLFSGSRIHRLRRGALLAGVTNLTIERSRIDEVESGAVNNTVAVVTLQHNHVALVRQQGFVLRKWNRLRVVNNTFDQLEEDSIWAPYQTVAGAPVSELRFSENRLGAVSAGGLRWLGAAAAGVGSKTAAGNVLEGTPCRCDLLDEDAAAWAADALLCRPAAPLLARCLRPSALPGAAPQPALSLSNFTAAVCGGGDVLVCQDAPAVLANADGEESGRRSTLVLALVLGAAAAGAAAVCGGAWLRRKRRRLPACLAALLSRRLDSGAGAAGAGARQAGDGSPGHEYAELQPQAAGTGPGPPDDDALLPAEDKWTQTLPEELTQELLQTLRDKLDDPDNYSEARDMIEHLYDLIKVEESGAEERETGEVIRRSARGATRSTGTRAPSPPVGAAVRVCGEYLEPRDRSPDHHLYAELPPAAGAPAAAALCEYAEPRDSHRHAAHHVYCELPANMADRPLPSTPSTR
ncbi:uncharacterized protein LOC126267347 [Schistocerca gregaria]|uniref:uncharacterized protein LOC126267347 n=1 Tax=Schistocerca gregaria TaxID=7010 RepID=UPI00211E3BF2|nr:uncharacterized protein LOC126267347 [Schistocerca gregaria]